MPYFVNKRHLLATWAFILSACVAAPKLPELSSNSTIYKGRFAVSYQKDNATQREQGGFEWKIQHFTQFDQAMQLTLLSPLGSAIAVIAIDPQSNADQRASLTTPLHTEYAPTLALLMQRTFGWGLPLSELIPWLAKDEPRDTPNNWKITVIDRYDNGLPKRMTAENTALHINVRLFFEE
jgi:outer membrane biogenesis lipoprotein LolB